MNAAVGDLVQEQLLPVDATTSVAMRRLFSEVFGHEMSAEHWHWKYADGRGCGIGLMRGDRMVAHYGGVTRAMVFEGRPLRACQVCDVMVTPSANRALVRKGPVFRVTARFLEQQVGHGLPHPVAYGFPSERAHGVAHRLGLYGQVDATIGLAWPAQESVASPRLRLQALARGTDGTLNEHAVVDRLWTRMMAGMTHSVLGVRDSTWLLHRYLAHPSISYEVWLVRRGLLRRPVGVVVLRQRETHLDLLDLVGPPSAFEWLIDAARQRAHALGLPRVEAWITESHRALLAPEGRTPATPTGMRLPLPHNLHTPGPSEAEMRDRWFLLAGDADFT